MDFDPGPGGRGGASGGVQPALVVRPSLYEHAGIAWIEAEPGRRALDCQATVMAGITEINAISNCKPCVEGLWFGDQDLDGFSYAGQLVGPSGIAYHELRVSVTVNEPSSSNIARNRFRLGFRNQYTELINMT